MSLGERGAYWNTDRLQNAASQSPSMLRFPRWMACQWRVEMGLCARGRTEPRRARQWVESRCQLSQSAFRVHHLPRLWKLLNFPPFHLFPSSPLLPFFRLFFFQLCSAFYSQSIWLRLCPFFFFLSSFSCISLKNALPLNTLPLFFQIASANALVSPAILSSETRDYIEAASTAADLSVCLTEAEQA